MVLKANETPVAIFNDTSRSCHFGCSLVMSELTRRLARHQFKPVWRHDVGEDWRNDQTALSGCAGAKLVIVNGEGSIHHSPIRPRAMALSEIGPFARDRLRVPAFLINSTIFDIDAQTADKLRAFTRIWVRDSASKSELACYGIASEVVPDLTIAAEFPTPEIRNGICATDSVLSDGSEVISSRATREGWSYRPMKWWRSGELPASAPKASDYAAFLSSHNLVVAGRYHAVVLCLATRTPFVAIESNTPKISFLLRDVFGATGRVVPLSRIETIDLSQFAKLTKAEERSLDLFLGQADKSINSMIGAIRESSRE